VTTATFFDTQYDELVESPNGLKWFMSMPLPDRRRISGLCHDKVREQKMWRSFFPSDTACATLAGKTVLDIGANDGYFSIAAALCGARQVTAINTDELNLGTYPSNIHFACKQWNVPVRIVVGDFVTVDARGETFDVIFCFGVLYHLENVFAAFKKLRTLLAPGGTIYVETQMTSLVVDRPVFEVASDTLPTTVPQYKNVIDSLGNSNFLLPNELALRSIADAYGLQLNWPGPNVWEEDYKTRKIYTLTAA
jgi:SAM-dependent methyltransferase